MFWYGFLTCLVGEVILVVFFVWLTRRFFLVKTEEEIFDEHIQNIHNEVMGQILSRLDRIEEVVKITTTGNLAHKKGNILQLLIGTKEILEKIVNQKK